MSSRGARKAAARNRAMGVGAAREGTTPAPRGQRGGGTAVALTTPIDTSQGMMGPENEWFGPGRPMPGMAPRSAEGRRYDYNFGQNVIQSPRGGMPTSFLLLRALADGHDLTRLAIETRKDQMSRLQFTFGLVDSDDDLSADQEKRAAGYRALLRRPDGKLFWVDWLRSVLEDLLVIDAPSIFVRRTMDESEIVGLYQIDGATIKPVIDEGGREPEPPECAYQQFLKGVPAFNYTSQQLVYRPRNVRVHTIYGYSPVEQIIATINIALRRQIWQHAYFTNGNIPDSLIGVPSTWSPDQIRDFQDWFDGILTGNTERRRGALFVPGEVAKSYVPTKDAEMFGQAEEWLARVVCFCFGISHQSLVKEVNRATADNAADQALEDGLAPIMGWVKSLMDGILIDQFGETDLEFRWVDDKELDPKIQDEIWKGRVDAGMASRNEWRGAVGEKPRPEPEAELLFSTTTLNLLPSTEGEEDGEEQEMVDGQPVAESTDIQAQALNGAQVSALIEMVQQTVARELSAETATILISIAFPAVPQEQIKALVTAASRQPEPEAEPVPDGLDSASGGAGGPDDGGEPSSSTPQEEEGAEKGALPFGVTKSSVDEILGKIGTTRPEAVRLRKRLQTVIEDALARQGAAVTGAVAAHLEQSSKADDADDAVTEAIIRLALDALEDWDFLIDEVGDILSELAEDTSRAALAMIGGEHMDDIVDVVNERAVAQARERAAELVGRRILSDGSIVDNPDARWAITSSTRDMIGDTITSVLRDNAGSDVLIEQLQEAYAFSPARAEMVSRTEIAAANSRASTDTYAEAREAGVSVRKEWILGGNPCEICEANAAEGPIDLDDSFSSGDDEPPAHPNCECAVSPVVEEDS